eukprot:TCONS_00060091-protein
MITSLLLTEADFINEINTLSSNSAPGPDDFPAILLKKSQITTCNSSLSYLEKHSRQKSNPPSTEIKLHPTSSKKAIKIYQKTNLFNSKQPGFRSRRSCLSQLLSHTEQLIHQYP